MSKGLSQFRPRGQIEASPRMFGVEEYTEASGDVDDRGTPWELFLALHEEFGFTIDVASSDANAKLIRHWTQDDDGLEKSWGGERVWCNPPYSDLRRWTKKAWDESGEAQLIVMLMPANRTEQSWWQDLVEPFRDRFPENYFSTRFIAGRVNFIEPGDLKPRPDSRPPFASVLLIWRPE